jgi:hypothetical protein
MRRVPVLGVRNRCAGPERSIDLSVHHWHDLSSAANGEAARRVGEVVLQVDDDQSHLRVVSGIRIADFPPIALRRP